MKKAKAKGLYERFFKRLLDIILSFIAIILLSPVFLIVALFVRIKLGSPVIFKQERPGLNEKIFTMYKFRTMTDERDGDGDLLPNVMRHTKFGKFLRSTSLDELPELLNVLKGEMSLVGPRPLLVEYLSLYNDEQCLRHKVRPGITGYAQVNGRNAITWEEKFEKDVYYVQNLNLLLDLRILFQTVIAVLKKENINQNNNTTMEPFKGSEH